jgi:pimeloyl-ACP methyl ester carboxylesterase
MIQMRTKMIFALVSIAALMAILGAAIYARNGPVDRWLKFSAWKLTEGRAHGGQYVNANDISIYYETYGAGPPVLVLHGGFGSIESMSNQIEALAKSHFVIAADSRSHGRSTDSGAPLSYALMSDDMLKLLDHLRIDRTDIVGWSDGAMIAFDLALCHPERVGRLVAIGADYDVDGIVEHASPDLKVPPTPLTYKLFARDPDHWPTLYREVHTMWNTQQHYTLDRLARIKAPTLIVAGEFDAIKREHTAQLAKAISGTEEVIIPGATHNAPIEKPEIVNRHMLKFLQEQPDGGVK